MYTDIYTHTHIRHAHGVDVHTDTAHMTPMYTLTHMHTKAKTHTHTCKRIHRYTHMLCAYAHTHTTHSYMLIDLGYVLAGLALASSKIVQGPQGGMSQEINSWKWIYAMQALECCLVQKLVNVFV